MKKKTVLYRALAVLFALAVWQAAAMLVRSSMLLASPLQVTQRFFTLIFEPDFFGTVLYSFGRIVLGFLAAVLLGILAAVAAGRFRAVEYLLWPFVLTVKSVPVASFIILFLIWLTFGQLTVFISFLIAFPLIYSNVLQGIKSTDGKLKEMAELYRVPWGRRFIYLYIPAVKPFLLSACTVGAGMAWKAGVAAEVIGIVTGSIGEKLYDAKIYFQNADLLAWTVVIVLLSVLTEKLFLFLLKRFFAGVERI